MQGITITGGGGEIIFCLAMLWCLHWFISRSGVILGLWKTMYGSEVQKLVVDIYIYITWSSEVGSLYIYIYIYISLFNRGELHEDVAYALQSVHSGRMMYDVETRSSSWYVCFVFIAYLWSMCWLLWAIVVVKKDIYLNTYTITSLCDNLLLDNSFHHSCSITALCE